MLRDLLDHHMQHLDRFERIITEQDYSEEQAHVFIRGVAEDLEWRVALILDPKSHPDRWLFELAEFLQTMEDDDIRAMAQKSEAAGNPLLGYEFVVSQQITAALLRGHLSLAEA